MTYDDDRGLRRPPTDEIYMSIAAVSSGISGSPKTITDTDELPRA